MWLISKDKQKSDKRKIVVALGGNALQRNGEASAAAQQKVADETARNLVPLIKAGHQLVIVHGNGPQVGNIVIHEEAINTDKVPTLPLDTCVAMSQGSIGYWLQQAITDELRKVSLTTPVVTLVTQMLVDANDPGFLNPSKPIGPFYADEATARAAASERGFVVKEDSGRGWRRVVPSPVPRELVEKQAVRQLIDNGSVVIAGGGGGVPVIITENEGFKGVEAVIDKDFSAAVIADLIDADSLIILTSVGGAMLNFGKPEQQLLGEIKASTLQGYVDQGQFAAGSMLPKVQAAIKFVSKTNRRAIIASLDSVAEALSEKSGTIVTF